MSFAVRTVADLVYVDASERRLELDLHLPDGPAGEHGFPCIVYFHGGGWVRGDRRDFIAERVHPVVRTGVAVASVSYRSTDVATHPAQLQDARAAVAWLREHAAEFGLRDDRIGAWGASAGGWIALMLALAPPESTAGGVQAACAWYPVTDLTTTASDRAAADLPMPGFLDGRPLPIPSFEARLLGAESVTNARGAARAASPVTHVETAGGPVLLIHGDGDGLTNDRQSRRLHEALIAAGRASELLLIAGANHEGPEFHSPAVLSAVAGFFQANL